MEGNENGYVYRVRISYIITNHSGDEVLHGGQNILRKRNRETQASATRFLIPPQPYQI